MICLYTIQLFVRISLSTQRRLARVWYLQGTNLILVYISRTNDRLRASLRRLRGWLLAEGMIVHEAGGSIRFGGAPRQAGPGGKRQRVKALSKKSRGGLRRMALQFDLLTSPWHVILAYPPESATVVQSVHKDMDRLCQALMRQWGKGWGAVWVLHFKRSGCPHFHLILWHIDEVVERATFAEWLAKRWNRLVAPGDETHRRTGVQVDEVDDLHALRLYLTTSDAARRQMQLPPVYADGIGRWWGCRRKENIPFAPGRGLEPACPDWRVRVRRFMKRYLNAQYRNLFRQGQVDRRKKVRGFRQLGAYHVGDPAAFADALVRLGILKESKPSW